MRNALRKFLFLPILVALLCPKLFADQVSLKNGDRLTGTIMKSDAKTIVVKTEAAGDVTIQWSAVDSISSTQALHVGLAGGQMVVGPVTTKDGQIQITTLAAGVVTSSKDSVQVIRSDEEQSAYDKAMERLQHPHLADFWSGALDTGLSLTRGNSSTLSYTFSGKAVRQTERDKITVYTTAVYGKNNTTSPSQVIAHQIAGGVRGDVNFTARAFAFATTDFNSNALQNLDLANVVAGGVGIHAIKTKTVAFDLDGGAGYNQEFFSAYTRPNPAPPPATLSFPAVTQRNVVAQAGEQFDTKLGSRSSFSETFNYFPNLTGPSGYHCTFNSVVSTAISKWLGWQFTLADSFLSNPPVSIKKNDLLLSTGLRVTFGSPK
jgi:putative salt-induced outer membrane protein YdiY